MQIGNKIFDTENNCYIMGILNFTPDSFSDGGQFNDLDKALYHVEKMIADGMDILDIGGESTRPNYTKISVAEEIERTAPIIEAVRRRFEIPVSLDTYKYQVAEAGIQAGADLINDIWGLQYDHGEMAELLARTKLPCCLMHNRDMPHAQDFFENLIADMRQVIHTALRAGIEASNMILDPGIGFGKSYEHNLEAIRKLDLFRESLGYPVLLGTSRKSVIGLTLDLPVTERMEGTLATTVIGVMKGVSFIRVHDIPENARAVRMTQAIMKG